MTPVDWASSSDRTLNTTWRYTRRATTTIGTEMPIARSASTRVTVVMSPKSASRRSTCGVRRIPTASAVTNKTPMIDSGNNLVVRSMYHVSTAAENRKANAPKNGLKLNRIPSARPGKATWESASPTSAIRFRTMREPT